MQSSTPPPGVGGLAWFCVSSLAVPLLFCFGTHRPLRLEMDALFIDNMALLVAATPLLLALPIWRSVPGGSVGQIGLLSVLVATLCTPLWLFLAARPLPSTPGSLAREGLIMVLCWAIPAVGLVAMQRAQKRALGDRTSGELRLGRRASLVGMFRWGLRLEGAHPVGRVTHLELDRWRTVTWIFLFLSLGEAVFFHLVIWPESPPLSVSVLTLHALVMVTFVGDCRALSIPIVQRTPNGVRIQSGMRACLDLSPGQVTAVEGVQCPEARDLNLSLLGEANCRVRVDPPCMVGGLFGGRMVSQFTLGVSDRTRLRQALGLSQGPGTPP